VHARNLEAGHARSAGETQAGRRTQGTLAGHLQRPGGPVKAPDYLGGTQVRDLLQRGGDELVPLLVHGVVLAAVQRQRLDLIPRRRRLPLHAARRQVLRR